jgi:hypothetical protein
MSTRLADIGRAPRLIQLERRDFRVGIATQRHRPELRFMLKGSPWSGTNRTSRVLTYATSLFTVPVILPSFDGKSFPDYAIQCGKCWQ